ncbi:MAG: MipA/OmpV family protein [Sphingomonadales bacterium]|nr:MAG: MipA/OmpV family protein [Sphingomonadales bacterium]
MTRTIFTAALLCAISAPAFAQSEAPPKEPVRVRVGLGAQLSPSFPGSRDHSVRPYWDLSIARGDTPFEYEAADEPFGFPLIKTGGFEFGPAINLESSRRRKDVGAPIDEVGFSVEAGGFAQLWVAPGLRVRAEARHGITGHKSLVGSLGADYVARDGDKWQFAIGPRVSLSDRGYQQAYFGVSPRVATATGLPQYRPKAGVHAVGAIAGMHYALGDRWGVMAFAKYDRLVGDAGDSPMIRTYGKRDQLSGGLGLTYTFGRGVR